MSIKFEILTILNIFLGFVLGFLCARHLKSFAIVKKWWQRILILPIFFAIYEGAVFLRLETLAVIFKVVFILYFVYIAYSLATGAKKIQAELNEAKELKDQLSKVERDI